MRGVGKEIPKGETYNKYGEAARKLKLKRSKNMALLFEFHLVKSPIGGSLIEGGLVYAIKNKSLSAGYAKTGAYLDENRKLGAWFRVEGFQELAEDNAASPTVQLQSVRIALAVIA